MSERLPAAVEAGGILRRVQAEGGFGAIVQRGDKDRGALILLVAERGRPVAVLERRMTADFAYRWAETAISSESEGGFQPTIDLRTRFDPDLWLIELDVADAERFIAETIAEG